MIHLTINGKPRELDDGTTLLTYLQEVRINPQIVAVEYNGEIVKRDHYADTQLAEGDTLEIVRMVGGG